MKYLLCFFESQGQKKLVEHCLTYRNIDSKNWFFRKLFQLDNKPFLRNCIRCKQFLTSRKEKATHYFLKHCSDGKEIPFEEKPLDIMRYPALTIYQTEYKKYSNLYPFYNSEKCVNDFSLNVKQRFNATDKKWFKRSFTIENTQNSIHPNLEPLVNNRYWATESYDNIYFNKYIFHIYLTF